MTTPTRDAAWSLLKQYTLREALIKHALSVEIVMRHLARKHNENEDMWGIVGLVHDLDYDQFPSEHCRKTREILEQNAWPETYIRAVDAHAWELFTNVKPETLMEKYLYASDELTGFVIACALIRPSKKIGDLEIDSIMKKWPQKNFAAGVNRSVVEKGCAMLDIRLQDLASEVLAALKHRSDELGL